MSDPDLKIPLDHARELFQYHAGQRLNSIRYFLIAWAVLLTGYLGLFGKTNGIDLPSYIYCVVSGSTIVLTIVFWLLDWRNAQLVNIDEAALKEVEKKYLKNTIW